MKYVRYIGTGIGVSLFLICLFSCNTNQYAGNGTRLGNPTIVGTIYQPDGKSPAPDVMIHLRSKNALVDISTVGSVHGNDQSIAVVTDSEGKFVFTEIEIGTYMIECIDDSDNYAVYETVIVEDNNNTISLPADTLKPAGAITGHIRLPEGGELNKVYVLVFGVWKFATVNNSGNFFIDNLAEGTYSLRIISSLADYGVIDTPMISVVSGNNTDLGTIELPFTGTPLLKNISIDYDTLKNVVSLSWDQLDTSQILGVNVYRRTEYGFVDSLKLSYSGYELINDNKVYTKLNDFPVHEPFYHDSTAVQNRIYAYRLSVMRKDTTETVKSQELPLQAVACFSTDTVFRCDLMIKPGNKRDNPQLFTCNNGMLYVVHGTVVEVFDTNFNSIRFLSSTSMKPGEVAVDGTGRIWVSDIGERNMIQGIFIFNPNGELEKRLNISDNLDTIPPIGISAIRFTVSSQNNLVFVSSKKDSVYLCDSSGILIQKWGGFGDGTGGELYPGITTIATDAAGNIYIYELSKNISVYDQNGVFKRTIDILGLKTKYKYWNGNEYSITEISMMSCIHSMAVDSDGRIYLGAAGYINVIKQDGQFESIFNSESSVHNMVLAGQNIYWTTPVNGSIGQLIIKLKNNLY